MNIKREEILAVYEAGPEAVITLVNTIIAENQKIIDQQAIRISELEERVKYLEERLNKNSRNSSKPPSTDNSTPVRHNPKSQRIKSSKKPGGQKGHVGTTLAMVDNPVDTKVYTVDR
ncbi:MAG: IS66 family transposase, partial [Candidatus Methanoperedens sp.]|nr:IS66 family transposase [Candidatus Methanoperedens sp.]